MFHAKEFGKIINFKSPEDAKVKSNYYNPRGIFKIQYLHIAIAQMEMLMVYSVLNFRNIQFQNETFPYIHHSC